MSAILFIPLLAATWILGLALAVVASHYFLVVLESSASGSEKVVWPEEPMTDWLWKGVYMAWLGGAWVGPFLILGRVASPDAWVRFTFVACSFCLLFPLGMLSSLAAGSPWVPFWPGLFARLGQRPNAVFTFFLLNVPLTVAFVGAFHLMMVRKETPAGLAVVLAPVAAASFLVYARALGRLGLVLSFTTGGENEPVKRKRKRKKKEEKPRTGEHEEQPVFKQPSELPPIQTPFEGPVTGYDVALDDRPREPEPTSRRVVDEDEDLTPIPIAESDVDAPPPVRPPIPQASAEELALWDDRDRRVTEPARPFGATVVTFLGEPRAAKAWFVLAAGLALLGLMVQALRELRPA